MAEKDGIESLHPQYVMNYHNWELCNDVYEGEDAVKMKGERYLPKPLGQEDDEYKAYKTRATFFGGTARTVDGLTGAVMRVSPQVEVPTIMETWLEDVTGRGKTFDEFSREVVKQIILTGRMGILVDQTMTGERSILASYTEENITNWMMDENDEYLVFVILREWVDVQDDKDPFKVVSMVQYRELMLDDGRYTVRLWRKESTKKDAKYRVVATMTPTKNGATLDRIPFVFVSAHGTDTDVEKAPIKDMASINVSHYRTSADLEHGRHLTSLPTPYIVGMDPNEVSSNVKLGSGSVWIFENESTQVGMLEFTGAGLGHLSEALKEKMEQMSLLGARIIEPSRPGVEAAETARIHRQGDVSILSSIAGSASKALEEALRLAAEWNGQDSEEVTVELNKDYVDARLSSSDIQALLQARIAGEISQDTWLDNLARGEILPESRTIEEEKELIAAGAMSSALGFEEEEDEEEDETEEEEDDQARDDNG